MVELEYLCLSRGRSRFESQPGRVFFVSCDIDGCPRARTNAFISSFITPRLRKRKNHTPSLGLEPWIRGILTGKYTVPHHWWSCIVSGPDWCMPARIFAGDHKTFWNLICRCPSTTYLRRSKNCEKKFVRDWKNHTPSLGLEPWLRGILTGKYSLPQHWWS